MWHSAWKIAFYILKIYSICLDNIALSFYIFIRLSRIWWIPKLMAFLTSICCSAVFQDVYTDRYVCLLGYCKITKSCLSHTGKHQPKFKSLDLKDIKVYNGGWVYLWLKCQPKFKFLDLKTKIFWFGFVFWLDNFLNFSKYLW